MIRVGPRPTSRTIWIGHYVSNRCIGICRSCDDVDVRDARKRMPRMGEAQPLAKIMSYGPTMARRRIRPPGSNSLHNLPVRGLSLRSGAMTG